MNSLDKTIQDFSDYPIIDDVKDIEPGARHEDLDAHWVMVDQELKVWRFVYSLPETEPLSERDRFHPILLIHGYRSSHVTWNYMTQRLWTAGFRNIFGMELFDYKVGLERNSHHLDDVMKLVFELVSGYNSIDLIGHSMGGIVARFFAKNSDNRKKIRFIVTMGSAHKGLSGSVSFLIGILDRAKRTSRDLSSRKGGMLEKLNTTFTKEDQRITMLNIGGSLRRYRGTDGFVKPVKLGDMINIIVHSKHTLLNKQDTTSLMILSLLLRKAWIVKLSLIEVKIGKKIVKNTNIYIKFSIASKKRNQEFPIEEKLVLSPEEEKIKPNVPIIMFSDFFPFQDQTILKVKVFKERFLKHKGLITSRFIIIKETEKNSSQRLILEKKNVLSITMDLLYYYLPK